MNILVPAKFLLFLYLSEPLRHLVVPHVIACVPGHGRPCAAGCRAAGVFQGSTHFAIDWRAITALCLALQLGGGGVLLMALGPHLRRCGLLRRPLDKGGGSSDRNFHPPAMDCILALSGYIVCGSL